VTAGTGRVLKWIERAFLIAGLVCLIYVLAFWRNAATHQREDKRALARMTTGSPPSPPSAAVEAVETVPIESVIGALDIPRIGLSVSVREGDEDQTLVAAVGHLPDTPLPWAKGNAAFAGHRDTFFRPLRDLRTGDAIRLTTPHGTFNYRVRHTMVVEPDALWVLDDADDIDLTLITCYPFTYVGHAPHRFIVQAQRTDPK
jgi:sortase A